MIPVSFTRFYFIAIFSILGISVFAQDTTRRAPGPVIRVKYVRAGFGTNHISALQYGVSDLKHVAPGCPELQANYGGYTYSRLDASSTKKKFISSHGTYRNINIPIAVTLGLNTENQKLNKHMTFEIGMNYYTVGISDFYALKTEAISSGHYHFYNGVDMLDYDYDSAYQYRSDFFARGNAISLNPGIFFHFNNTLPVDISAGAFIGYDVYGKATIEITNRKKLYQNKTGSWTYNSFPPSSGVFDSTMVTTVDSSFTTCTVKIHSSRMGVPIRMSINKTVGRKNQAICVYGEAIVGREKTKIGNYSQARVYSTWNAGVAFRFY